jgi:hypothetical protein
MRLWALLPFLAIALALAGPPAFGQAPPNPPGQERAEEAKKNKEAKKAAQEAKKQAKKDEADDPGDDGGDGGDEDGGGGDSGEGGSDGNEGGGEDDQGEADGEPDGGGASAGQGGSGGQASGSGERSTDGSGSADEGRRSPLADDVACVDECTSARDGAAGVEGVAILAASGSGAPEERLLPTAAVDVLGGSPSGRSAFGPSTPVDGNPAVLALLSFSTLLLLVGLVGGWRALRGLGER